MSENTERYDEEGVPLDDQGIRNDEIIDILDTIIKDTWNDVCNTKQSLSFSERKEIATTLQCVWNLARNIMDADERMKMINDYFENDEDDDFFDDDYEGGIS